ncbi:MAG: hypothetical protein J0M26_21435 [Planctomycetes bacterium]|nr:hypothetical protein [Planctomycetota bacterium]
MSEYLYSILKELDTLFVKLANEANRNLKIVILDVFEPDNPIEYRIEKGIDFGTSTIEIRVKRRHDFLPTRFSLQALTMDLSAENGFNGFVGSGRLSESGEAKLYGRANRYNFPRWDADFLLDSSKS